MSSFKSNENIHKKEDGSYYRGGSSQGAPGACAPPLCPSTCS